jgi:hypothetical protein
MTVTVTSGSERMQDTFVLTVAPVADSPSVSPATTNEDTQTTTGLVINRNTADGPEVTQFKITSITNGTLFKNNGTTQINNGDFITFAEGNAGLKFTPAANLFSPTTTLSFNVQAATDASGSGLSSAATATITVTPIADTPSVTSATTTVNTQTTSGLVINRNAADSTEVSHFKITNITNGSLFKNDGTTQINNADFITFAEGNAGLQFTPTHNLVSPSSTFSFQVQGATSSGGAGLSSAATAPITVNCGPSVVTNTNDSGAGSLRDTINTACPGNTITFNIPAGDPGFGGGVYTITLTSAELLIDKNLTITGPGANLQISGNATVRVFNVTVGNPETVTLSGMVIANGTRFNENSQPGFGGGIANSGTGTVNVTNTSMVSNRAIFGGGVANLSSGTVNVRNCALTNNSAARGGAIFNAQAGKINVINSTISYNEVSDGSGTGGGAGIENDDNGLINITNSTVSYNRINFTGVGGGIHTNGGTVNVANSIIALNTDAGGNPDVSGVFHSVGYNLIGKKDGGAGFATGINGDQVGTTASPIDPLLGAMQDNGGTTRTFLLLPGSTAIDAGKNSLAKDENGNALTTDQRGADFLRPVNAITDIGAVEVNYIIIATAGTPQSAERNTPFGTQLVAVVREHDRNQNDISVTFNAPGSGASGTFPGNATTVTVTSDNGTAPIFTANGTAGTYNVVASLVGGSPSANFVLTNLKSNQTITVNTHAPASAPYNGNFTVAASSSSGLAVTYSSSGACTNVGAIFTMTGGTGTCTVKYDQGGDGNYNASPQATESVTAQKANQVITVNTHAPANAIYNANFTVAATSNSGLAVAYSSAGVCTNVGPVFTMTSGTGTCTVKYDQVGDGNYNPAPQVTESVTAQKANQTITFGALSAKTFGDPDFLVSATASPSLSVSFAASGQCTVTGTKVHLTGAGSCTITAKQVGDSNYNAATDVPQLFNIAKAATTTALSSSVNPSEFGQSVTFTATVTSAAGTPTGTVQFKDGVANIGSAQNLNAGGVAQLTTSALTAGLHTITADYSGDLNFLISSGTLSCGQVVKG